MIPESDATVQDCIAALFRAGEGDIGTDDAVLPVKMPGAVGVESNHPAVDLALRLGVVAERTPKRFVFDARGDDRVATPHLPLSMFPLID